MTNIADKFPDKYMQALTKLLPQQYNMQKTEFRAEVTYNSADEVKAALEEAGLTLKQIEVLEGMLPITANVHDGDSEYE
jgi:hypothetical protein